LVQRWEDRNELAKDLQDLIDQRTRLTNRIDAVAAELASMGVLEGDPE
jgi:5-enolpyruvylshikimate-3-phosphate synthase